MIVADFQEMKNSESVVGILPNTTSFRRTITRPLTARLGGGLAVRLVLFDGGG